MQEATIALVACGTSVENAVRAKDKISTLWRDTASEPYTQIFDRSRVTARSLYKAVRANRFVERFLKEKLERVGRAGIDEAGDQIRAIAVHGNRLLAYYVLNSINIWREDQPVEQFVQALSKIELNKPFECLVEEVFAEHGASYKAPLFKNRRKCTAIINALPEVERPAL